MANIDLLNLQPHQVSRDMRGYSVFFYGEPKSGKTTIATQFPGHLLLAFEKGYSAIPGAMAQPINTWGEFKKVLAQLKTSALVEKFETIIIDTADIAYDYCEKYICDNNNVDTIGDIEFGKGWNLAGREFDESLRKIVQYGYGLVLISHSTDKTFKDEAGNEFNQIVPTLSKRPETIVARLCDIIGYSRSITNEDGSSATRLFMRGTPRFVAGSRFKYTPDSIEFTYNNLVAAIGEAIDHQMEETDNTELFTDRKDNIYSVTSNELDFDALFTFFEQAVSDLQKNYESEIFSGYWAPRIVQITDKYLGRGKKVGDCSREQVEALDLVCAELQDLISRGVNTETSVDAVE